MKYYFITNNERTWLSGPFIIIENTPNNYVGQMIRSNDFSVKVQENYINVCLWCCDFGPSMTYQQVKEQLMKTLPNIDKENNVIFMVQMDGELNFRNPAYPYLEIIEKNIKYVLEFKYVNGILFCPSINISF